MPQQFRHFKGNLYTLLNVGRCQDENEFYAIYRRSDHPSSSVNGLARHSETEEPYLVFENGMIERAESMLDLIPEQFELVMQNAQKSGLWIRPLEMFYGYKEMDGRYVRRFDSHGW